MALSISLDSSTDEDEIGIRLDNLETSLQLNNEAIASVIQHSNIPSPSDVSREFKHDKWKWNFIAQGSVTVISIGVGSALIFTGNPLVGLPMVTSSVGFWLGKSTSDKQQ